LINLPRRVRDSWAPGPRRPATLPPGGTPAPPPGVTPAPSGPRAPGSPGRGHRAPPRGVDVKATPQSGSGEAPRGPETPKTPKNTKNSDFPGFWAFWSFLAKIALSEPRRTPRQGWFYINPSRRGPVTPFWGFWRGSPGNPVFRGFSVFFPVFGEIWDSGPFWADLGSPRPGAPGRRRAPARGVDVKPPSRGRTPRGPWSPGPWKRAQPRPGLPGVLGGLLGP